MSAHMALHAVHMDYVMRAHVTNWYGPTADHPGGWCRCYKGVVLPEPEPRAQPMEPPQKKRKKKEKNKKKKKNNKEKVRRCTPAFYTPCSYHDRHCSSHDVQLSHELHTTS